jgi:hypothetical protein
MVSLLRIVVALVLLLVVTGVVLLVAVDLQPPTERIEKIIPNDRFQR